jgi:hypothetical protein
MRCFPFHRLVEQIRMSEDSRVACKQSYRKRVTIDNWLLFVLYYGVLIRSNFGGVSAHIHTYTVALLTANKTLLAFANGVPVFACVHTRAHTHKVNDVLHCCTS